MKYLLVFLVQGTRKEALAVVLGSCKRHAVKEFPPFPNLFSFGRREEIRGRGLGQQRNGDPGGRTKMSPVA
jgi:hypothetical protein